MEICNRCNRAIKKIKSQADLMTPTPPCMCTIDGFRESLMIAHQAYLGMEKERDDLRAELNGLKLKLAKLNGGG